MHRGKIEIKENSKNAGYTLIEIIVTLALSTIVMGMLVMFMDYGIKAYRKAQDEVFIQQSSQIILSQLEELIIESKSLTTHTLDSNINAYVLNYNNEKHILVYNQVKQKLYYVDDYTGRTTDKILENLVYSDDYNLMEENITSFFVQRQSSEKTLWSISLSFKLGTNERTFIKQISSRN